MRNSVALIRNINLETDTFENFGAVRQKTFG